MDTPHQLAAGKTIRNRRLIVDPCITLGETGVPYRWEYPGLPSY
jgi:hypothetical protein